MSDEWTGYVILIRYLLLLVVFLSFFSRLNYYFNNLITK
jgi:hypothetical protein